MTDFFLDILISDAQGGFRWFVYNVNDGHVMAQGFNKSKARAKTAAVKAKVDFTYEITGVLA